MKTHDIVVACFSGMFEGNLRTEICNKRHFDIVRDLKVSQEAISRVLEKLENDQTVTLGRNKITLN